MPAPYARDLMTARRALIWGQYLFLAVGFVTIGYCAIVVSEAARYQLWAREHLAEPREASTTTQGADAISQQRSLLSGRAPTLVGRIDIPRVHISAMVGEGLRH
jgi:hypothetical protein